MKIEKYREFYKSVKGFNITKYLLSRKEGKLLSNIEIKKGRIARHKLNIIEEKAHIIATESEITRLNTRIIELKTRVTKIKSVLKLY